MKKVSLLDVCDIEGGTQPPKETFRYEPTKGYVRMLQIQDFKSDEKAVFIPESSRMKTCQIDDVLIARYGASIGQIHTGKSGAYNVALVKTVPDEGRLTKTFLWHLLRGKEFQNFIQGVGGRAAQAGFNKEDLARFEFYLPPLPEQRRITSILDKADALRTKRREALAQLDRLAQSIFVEMFGDQRAVVDEWPTVPVGEITGCIVPGRDKPKSFTGETPWVTTEDLEHLGFTIGKPNGPGLTAEEIGEVRARVIPEQSIVMSCVGNLGMVSIAAQDMVINQQLHSFQCQQRVNNIYLMHALAGQTAYMYSKASSTTLPYMNKSVCNSIPVKLPPLKLQELFAKRYLCIKQVKSRHLQLMDGFETLYKSIQHRAFRGEL